MLIQSEQLASQYRDNSAREYVNSANVVFVILILASIYVRLIDIGYNTLFLDEAIYVTVGNEVLNQNFDQNAISWMFGSYLFPITATVANYIGGEVGVRILSVLLNMVAIVAVYLAARRLFGSVVAALTLILFAFNGPNISLAQQAVYDGMSVMFLAVALCFGIYAATATERQHIRSLLVAMGVAFTFSILAKYISLLYAPALFGVVFGIRIVKARSIAKFFWQMDWVYAFLPILLIFGTYVIVQFNDLQTVFTGQYASQKSPRLDILIAIINDIGIISLIAILGMVMLIFSQYRYLMTKTKLMRGIYVLLFTSIFSSFWLLPLYHFVTSNARSLYKHEVFALVFLCPVAAYGIYTFVQYLSPTTTTPVSSTVRFGKNVIIMAIGVVLWLNGQFGLAQHYQYQYSWPTAQGVVSFLQQQPINSETRILGSASAIYEYYLGMTIEETRKIWVNIWYVNFFGLQGVDAIKVAIDTCQFDYIITDNYYATTIDKIIEVSVQSNPFYELVYSDTQQLRINALTTIKVYQLHPEHTCYATSFESSLRSS